MQLLNACMWLSVIVIMWHPVQQAGMGRTQQLSYRPVLLCAQASPGSCNDEEALSRVRMLQDHFCAYQVMPLTLC